MADEAKRLAFEEKKRQRALRFGAPAAGKSAAPATPNENQTKPPAVERTDSNKANIQKQRQLVAKENAKLEKQQRLAKEKEQREEKLKQQKEALLERKKRGREQAEREQLAHQKNQEAKLARQQVQQQREQQQKHKRAAEEGADQQQHKRQRQDGGGGTAIPQYVDFGHTFTEVPLGISIRQSEGYEVTTSRGMTEVGKVSKEGLPIEVSDVILTVNGIDVRQLNRVQLTEVVKGAQTAIGTSPIIIRFSRQRPNGSGGGGGGGGAEAEAAGKKRKRRSRGGAGGGDGEEGHRHEKRTAKAEQEAAKAAAAAAAADTPEARRAAAVGRQDAAARGATKSSLSAAAKLYNPLPNSEELWRRARRAAGQLTGGVGGFYSEKRAQVLAVEMQR